MLTSKSMQWFKRVWYKNRCTIAEAWEHYFMSQPCTLWAVVDAKEAWEKVKLSVCQLEMLILLISTGEISRTCSGVLHYTEVTPGGQGGRREKSQFMYHKGVQEAIQITQEMTNDKTIKEEATIHQETGGDTLLRHTRKWGSHLTPHLVLLSLSVTSQGMRRVTHCKGRHPSHKPPGSHSSLNIEVLSGPLEFPWPLYMNFIGFEAGTVLEF